MALFREFSISTCRARLLVHRLVMLVALSACQAGGAAWRALLSDCPTALSVCRGVPSVPLLACQAVSSVWRAVLSACQAAPWLSHFSPVPRLENRSGLPGKPMRLRPLASVISISSNSSGMVPCSTSARRLGGQGRDQNQQGGGDNSHIIAGDMLFFDDLRCPVAPKMRLTPDVRAALNMPLSPMARSPHQAWRARGPRSPQINFSGSIH